MTTSKFFKLYRGGWLHFTAISQWRSAENKYRQPTDVLDRCADLHMSMSGIAKAIGIIDASFLLLRITDFNNSHLIWALRLLGIGLGAGAVWKMFEFRKEYGLIRELRNDYGDLLAYPFFKHLHPNAGWKVSCEVVEFGLVSFASYDIKEDILPMSGIFTTDRQKEMSITVKAHRVAYKFRLVGAHFEIYLKKAQEKLARN